MFSDTGVRVSRVSGKCGINDRNVCEAWYAKSGGRTLCVSDCRLLVSLVSILTVSLWQCRGHTQVDAVLSAGSATAHVTAVRHRR